MTTNKQTWKQVSISGVTGILMGAGAMKSMQSKASDIEDNAEQAASENSYDDMSFREAFDAARAELGAGGVFRWHGNIFNTYTADEWAAMSEEEHQDFAEQVSPEVSAEDVDTSDLAEIQQEVASETDADVSVAVDNNTHVENEAELVAANEQVVESTDDDVRVVGFGEVTLNNGQNVTVQEMDYNGQRVAIIDLDQDGEADIAMSDINHNNQMDEGEVIDLHTGENLTFTNNDDNIELTSDNFDI